MIYTVTFNPALDVSGTVDELIPDEKCYIHGELRTAGGNGINAGIIASRLGMPVTLTGFIGGANGSELKSLLSKQLLTTAFIPINGNTRMNITISHDLTHRQTRLSFAGPIVRLTEWNKLTKFLKRLKAGKDLAILGGSLPPGIAPKNIADLVRSLRKKGIFCMVDMPAQTLVKVVQSHPDFIKPNLEEFQQLTGSKVITIKGVLQSMQKLQLSVPVSYTHLTLPTNREV